MTRFDLILMTSLLIKGIADFTYLLFFGSVINYWKTFSTFRCFFSVDYDYLNWFYRCKESHYNMRYRFTFILQHTESYFVRDCSDILSEYVCTDINTFYSWDFFYQKKAYGEKWEKLLRDIALQRLCQVRQMAFVTHCAWTFTSWCAILTYRLS